MATDKIAGKIYQVCEEREIDILSMRERER
jgi:hypothetical protein